jgi:hypothetical protein
MKKAREEVEKEKSNELELRRVRTARLGMETRISSWLFAFGTVAERKAPPSPMILPHLRPTL